jgi:hypothetical protein
MTSVDASPAPAKTSWKTSSKLGFPLGQRSKVPSWQRADQAYAPVMVAIVAAAQISQAAAEAKVSLLCGCACYTSASYATERTNALKSSQRMSETCPRDKARERCSSGKPDHPSRARANAEPALDDSEQIAKL